MTEADRRIAQLEPCLAAYGVQSRSISWLARGTYAEVYKAETDVGFLVLRIRAPEAQAEEVLFAGEWAKAVSSQAEVVSPLRPTGDVPMIDNRCVDVAPYIENDGYNEVGPDAWVKIGSWLGTMHRLARGVEDRAPVALDYGNHPHEGLFDRYLEQSRIGCTSDAHLKLMRRVDSAVQSISQAVGSRFEDLPVGVVHGDLHFWNVLYRADQPACIIDLDFLQRGVLLHDLAYASHWLKEWTKRGGVWSDITARYLAAYEEGRESALTATEQSCLPWLLAYSGVFFFVSKARVSWNRLTQDQHDLEQAEDVIRELEDR
ncbi:MAG TPA: phosphotransferase [Candidatus Latescibacteria bacterium]|nr:phosphotransferase [Candidatus Latescibacterota bacterium]HJP33236.1 phosphotransferase [Candidatus Latescibacterota bacterium]